MEVFVMCSSKYMIHINNNQELHTPVMMTAALQYLNKLDFVKTINRNVQWDKKQCRLSPGHLALSIILSTFSEIRSPLYQIKNNFDGMNLELLFISGITKEYLNDDAIGRALDKIAESGSSNLYSKIALNGYSTFDMSFERLHSDTSSCSLYGEYAQCDSPEYQGVTITEGFSKDHRPDLKQFMVGTITNEHGIPLYHKTLNGNTADCTWNHEAILSLQDLFGDRLEDKIYIADSKLVTMPNLILFGQRDKKLCFLSRCPDSFHKKLAQKVKRQAYEKNAWIDIASLKDDKYHTKYQGQEFLETLYMTDSEKVLHTLPVRLFVYRSLDGTNRIEKRLKKEEERILAKKLIIEKKGFACLEDAEKAAQEFYKAKYHELIDIKTTTRSETKETRGRGRIGSQPRPLQSKTTWYVEVTIIGKNAERVQKAQQIAETFVLITNTLPGMLNLETALYQYKGQHKVEVLFHLLKTPALAAQVFLKKTERIEALIMLLHVSLLVRSLMQHTAREREKLLEELPRIDFNKGILKNPTTQHLLKLINHVMLVSKGEHCYYSVTGELEYKRLQHILYLLDIPVDG